MTMPGDRLLALATRVCSARAIERVLGPAIADLRWEYREAQHHHRMWRARWIRATGSLTVLYLIARQGSLDGRGSPAPLPTAASSLARVIAGSVALVVIMTVALVAIVMSNTPIPIGQHPLLVLYLLPSTIPFTVPCGFALTVSWVRTGGTRQSAPRIWMTAAALSVMTLITIGWITPAANQAYRVTVTGTQLSTGFNELTLFETRDRLAQERERLSRPFGNAGNPVDPTRHIRAEEYSYQTRLAVSVAPFVLGLFAFSVSARARALRIVGMISMLVVYFAWYGLMRSPVKTFSGLSPTLIAWLPNVALLVAGACAFSLRRSRSGPG